MSQIYFTCIELAPEFNGKESEIATASNGLLASGGIPVWINAPDSYFTNLPDFLVGQTFFRMPKIVDRNERLNITIYQASTIFIAMDTSSASTSEWENSLTDEKWVNQIGEVNTSLGNLNSIFRKDISTNDITRILLPERNFEFKAVVFVTGKLSRSIIIDLVNSEYIICL